MKTDIFKNKCLNGWCQVSSEGVIYKASDRQQLTNWTVKRVNEWLKTICDVSA